MANYLNNKDIYRELLICRDTSILYTNNLLEYYYKLSDKISRKVSHDSEDDRQDLIQGGVIDALMYSHNFDPSKGTNAFAYLTSIVYNGQLKMYRKLYTYRRFKLKKISINDIWSL